MKKRTIVCLGVICLLLVIGVFTMHLQIITLETGEKAVVYAAPAASAPGSVANSDLCHDLASLYGEEGVQTELLRCQWQGQDAVIYDTSTFETAYLGRTFSGCDYLSCKVTTVRTVALAGGSQETLLDSTRTCTYLGRDDTDLNSGVRASILWETLQEEYTDSQEYFDGLLLPDAEP